MKKDFDAIKLIGFAGMLLGGIATLIANYASEQQMKQAVKEEVEAQLALAERNEEETNN